MIDSLDWLERLIWDELCQQYGVNSIEKVDGGYARGYTHALTHWRRVLNDLNDLRNNLGMCVILLAHAKVEKFEDPEHSAYDRYSPRLHKHANALVTEWADAVLFATRRIITKTEDGFNRSRTTGPGSARMVVNASCSASAPACVAKNRYYCRRASAELAGPHRCNDSLRTQIRRLIYGEPQQLRRQQVGQNAGFDPSRLQVRGDHRFGNAADQNGGGSYLELSSPSWRVNTKARSGTASA